MDTVLSQYDNIFSHSDIMNKIINDVNTLTGKEIETIESV